MKTLYSILSVSLNQALGEKISVGLLMFNSQDSIFRFSKEKFKLIRPFLSANNTSLLKTYFQKMEEDVNVIATGLFENKSWVSESYISYLGKYANNNIHFSEPKEIFIDLNSENSERLYHKYVYQESVKESNVKDNFEVKLENWRYQFYPKVKRYVNTAIELTNEKMPNLVVPITIDLLGQNEIPMAAQTINFSRRIDLLEKEVANYISFMRALGDTPGTFFVIGEEPPKKLSNNHNLWTNVKTSNFMKYTSIGETERVEEYIKEHEVQPYFSGI